MRTRNQTARPFPARGDVVKRANDILNNCPVHSLAGGGGGGGEVQSLGDMTLTFSSPMCSLRLEGGRGGGGGGRYWQT